MADPRATRLKLLDELLAFTTKERTRSLKAKYRPEPKPEPAAEPAPEPELDLSALADLVPSGD